MSDCLTTSEVANLLADKAAPADIVRAEAHQQECAKCRRDVAQLRQALGRKNLRAALWIVGIGVFFGGVLPLGLMVAAVSVLLHNVRDTYAKFPSLPMPWLATIDLTSISEPVQRLLLLIVTLSGPWMGLVIARKLRPQGLGADAGVGWLTGLVAGLSLYVAGVGWAVMLAMITVPALVDLQLLGKGYTTRQPPPAVEGAAKPPAHPQDALLERYPDLADVAEHERGARLFSKIVADQVVASAYAIWISLPLILLCFGLVGVGQTMSAGYLLRRDGLRLLMLFPYLELALATEWLAVSVCAFAVSSFWSWPGLEVVLPLSLTAVAVTGVMRRWPALVRYSLYASWFMVGKLLFDTPLPWYADVLIFVVTAVILVRFFRQTPQPMQPAPEKPAVEPPVPAASAPAAPEAAASAPPAPDPAPSAPVEVTAGAAEAAKPDPSVPGTDGSATEAGFDWERLK